MKRLILASLLLATPALAQTAPPPAPAPTGVDVDYLLVDDNGLHLPPYCAVPAVKAAPAMAETATTPATPAVAAKPAEECKPFTIGFVFKRVLLWPNYAGEDRLAPDKLADMKWSRWALARRVEAGGRIELKKVEADVLSKLMAQLYSPVVVGQIMPMLYPNLQPPEIQ